MSNINKRSDLFRQYARVMDMCEGTKVHVDECVKFEGASWHSVEDRHPPEFDSPYEKYDFAVAILEGRPLFVGDTVYHAGGKMVISEFGPPIKEFIDQITWYKPERKIKIAGIKLPRPVSDETGVGFRLMGIQYRFRSSVDMDEFIDCLNLLIDRAMKETK